MGLEQVSIVSEDPLPSSTEALLNVARTVCLGSGVNEFVKQGV